MLIAFKRCKQIPVPTELFLDLVDYELCLRIRDAGLAIIVNPLSRLTHGMGNPQVIKIFGISIRANNYSALRWYYYFRNSAFLESTRCSIGIKPIILARRVLALRTPLKDALVFRDMRRFFCAAIGLLDGTRRKLGKRSFAKTERIS